VIAHGLTSNSFTKEVSVVSISQLQELWNTSALFAGWMVKEYLNEALALVVCDFICVLRIVVCSTCFVFIACPGLACYADGTAVRQTNSQNKNFYNIYLIVSQKTSNFIILSNFNVPASKQATFDT